MALVEKRSRRHERFGGLIVAMVPETSSMNALVCSQQSIFSWCSGIGGLRLAATHPSPEKRRKMGTLICGKVGMGHPPIGEFAYIDFILGCAVSPSLGAWSPSCRVEPRAVAKRGQSLVLMPLNSRVQVQVPAPQLSVSHIHASYSH